MSTSRPTPSWPSLYNFLVEIEPIQHRDAVQTKGRYLYDSADIFRFTLYWTLVLHTPTFIFCAIYAFLNLTFTPHSPVRRFLHLTHKARRRPSLAESEVPLRSYVHGLPGTVSDTHSLTPCKSQLRHNERRSRLAFALLVALTFTLYAVGAAVVGAAVMGYVMAGLFRAARFNMSTWIPFIMAIIQTSIGLLGLWPSVIDII